MEELTESARQYLVSQAIIVGVLSFLNSLALIFIGISVMIRAYDILYFTSLTHLAILELDDNFLDFFFFPFVMVMLLEFVNHHHDTVCGGLSCLTTIHTWWIIIAYRIRQLELRSKYLDENMSRALVTLLLAFLLSFSALVVSAVFLTLKVQSSSTYDLKTAMSLYSTDVTRKEIVDKLQIIFKCCGSLSLLDWFLVDWQNSDLQPGIHFHNGSISDWDSVPFSCCFIEAPPPCVHHQLRAFGVGSLYTTGCADKLDAAVFTFVLIALIMFFISTFLTTMLLFLCRKVQTSSRSAFFKGDATAPGAWWLLSPSLCLYKKESEDCLPLMGRKTSESKKTTIKETPCYFVHKKSTLSPFLDKKRYKKKEETILQELEISKASTKNQYGECSEDWTRMANDASESTSSASLLTSTRASNSTLETRHSVSDTAVANLEVSHHYEHKIRPLYRT